MIALTHRPAAGNMNQGFGPRPKPTPTSPAIHYGQDYGWGGGDRIDAAASGRVKSYSFSGAYGKRLVIDHGNGVETWYCHTTSATVAVGDWVDGGEQAAWMGATGNVVGKHLHFELRINGAAVNPAPYFGSAPAGDNQTNIPNIPEDDMFSDGDRALLNSIATMAAKAAQATNLPVLVKTADSNKVWLSNLVTRRLVNDSIELGNIQMSLASRGLDSGVNTVADLDVFGVPVAATL